MIRGTIAALVPIEVCTMNLVSGIIATSKIIKGSERTILIIGFNMVYRALFSNTPPGRVTTSKIPNGMPINEPTNRETPTICMVSMIACKNWSPVTVVENM
ncbi:hypothetical protein D3C75_992650 [compost metagenome]